MGGDEAGNDPADVFKVARIRRLVELMESHDLTEVDLRHGNQRIKLRRGGEPIAYALPASGPPPIGTGSAGLPAGESSPSQPHSTDLAAAEGNVVLIKSPMVGTYYSRPNPESDNFVKVGDMVTAETTVCIIEAMKVFNEIAAEVSGKIVAVLAENEEPVEYGKPLFKVEVSK